MGTVLRRFPRKTVNSQTDSDAAYTFRACINKSAREFQKEKSVYFTCMLSTTILKLSSMQIGFLCRAFQSAERDLRKIAQIMLFMSNEKPLKSIIGVTLS